MISDMISYCEIVEHVRVTHGNLYDSIPYLSRLDRQTERFGFAVEAVALDSGYLTTPICNGLEKRKMFAIIAHRRFHPTQGLLHKREFTYDSGRNVYDWDEEALARCLPS